MSALDDRLTLLAHEQLHVVETPAGLTGATRALPAPEGLHARPRARRGSGAPVDVNDSCMDAAEEPVDLALVLAVEPGCQSILGVVGVVHCLVERIDRTERNQRNEELLLPDV